MANETPDDYLELAISIAKAAGEMINETFHEEKSYEFKSNHADMCTETDRNVEEMLFNRIREKYPEHRLIGEESQSDGHREEFTDLPTWIIDPIDGTTNFIHRYEYICISIGVWVKRQPVASVIYNPVKDEMYTARVGKGAFKNGKPIHVSKITELSKALVTTECHLYPTMEQVDIKLKNIREVLQKSQGIRGTGSSAISMTLVASGSYDGHFEFGLHCWDIAAGALLVTEAGGVVIDPEGGPLQLMSRRVLAACSQRVAEDLSSLLTTIPFKPDCC